MMDGLGDVDPKSAEGQKFTAVRLRGGFSALEVAPSAAMNAAP